MNAALRPGTMVPESSPVDSYMGSIAAPIGGARVFINNKDEAYAYLDTRTAQLVSLLQLIHGFGGDTFRESNADLQDNILWIASGLAEEVKGVVGLIAADARRGGAA